jgi:hypothetical protein
MKDDETTKRGERPAPPVPPPPSLLNTTIRSTLFTGLFVVLSPFFGYLAATKWPILKDVYIKASRKSILEEEGNGARDDKLVDKLWLMPVASKYFSAVEYQYAEGYCGLATMRCMLKSLLSSSQKITEDMVPEPKRGPMTLTTFAGRIDEQTKGSLKSRVVLGSQGYEEFLSVVKQANNPNVRIAANFLRSPIFGFTGTLLLPMNIMKTFFGGHFSPIVGYLEKEDLVGVFDVNSNYSLYLVPSRRLYDAVNTYDVQSGSCRGLVISQVV